MSASSGPSIQTDGLVFDYDMSNTQKSFKGAPTTNLLTNPNSAINVNSTDIPLGISLIGYSSYSTGYNVADWAVTSTAAAGVTFSFSIYMRSPGAVSTYLFYAYTGTGPDGGWFGIGSGALTNTWTRYTFTTGSLTGTLTTIRIYRLNQAGTIELAAPQVEVSSVASTFVVGTRSSTQAIVDLTGRNTITANSLTYASDGTFSFNGSSNNLSIGSFSGYSTNITCEAWFKTTSGATWKNIVCGPGGDVIFTVNGALLNFGTQNSSPIPHANYSTTTVNTGAWFYGVATYDGSNVRIYINGNLESTNARTGTITSGAKNIGSNSGGSSEYFNGTIATVRVYNRAMSATEIQQNFNAQRTRYGI
jgi:hypothetical protein